MGFHKESKEGLGRLAMSSGSGFLRLSPPWVLTEMTEDTVEDPESYRWTDCGRDEKESTTHEKS